MDFSFAPQRETTSAQCADVAQFVKVDNQVFGVLGDPGLASLIEFFGVLGVHAAAHLYQDGLVELLRFDIHQGLITAPSLTEGRRVPQTSDSPPMGIPEPRVMMSPNLTAS